MYYFVSRQNFILREQRPRRGDQSPLSRRRVDEHGTAETTILIFMLFALRIVAVHLLQHLSTHLHALAMPALDDTAIYFVVLSLAVVLMDQSANIGLASDGDLDGPWMNVLQSVLSTYFFLRPLTALGGYNVDPSGGRAGLGGTLLLSAVWLQVPGVSSKLREVVGHGARD